MDSAEAQAKYLRLMAHLYQEEEKKACPTCSAPAGQGCVALNSKKPKTTHHQARQISMDGMLS